MTLNNQRIQSAIAGGIGGTVSWLLIEPLVIPQLGRVTNLLELYTIDIFFGALAGVCIGVALGLVEGLTPGSMYRVWHRVLIGAVVGIIGGAIGLVFGEMVYQSLKFLSFAGRTLGWAVFGAFLGAAQGMTQHSWRGVGNAALGGLIGGAIGGFIFDLIVTILLLSSSALNRAVALAIVGSSIGLWITLLQRVLAPHFTHPPTASRPNQFPPPTSRPNQAPPTAFVPSMTQRPSPRPVPVPAFSVTPSPSAPRQTPSKASSPVTLWLVEQRTNRRHALQPTVTSIGRNGNNDIVLDASTVSGSHAEIRHENGHYILYDKGSSNGTFVNGRRIAGANMLKAGWPVRIGTVELMVIQ